MRKVGRDLSPSHRCLEAFGKWRGGGACGNSGAHNSNAVGPAGRIIKTYQVQSFCPGRRGKGAGRGAADEGAEGISFSSFLSCLTRTTSECFIGNMLGGGGDHVGGGGRRRPTEEEGVKKPSFTGRAQGQQALKRGKNSPPP